MQLDTSCIVIHILLLSYSFWFLWMLLVLSFWLFHFLDKKWGDQWSFPMNEIAFIKDDWRINKFWTKPCNEGLFPEEKGWKPKFYGRYFIKSGMKICSNANLNLLNLINQDEGQNHIKKFLFISRSFSIIDNLKFKI